METLYHYTCAHSAPSIRSTGVLHPTPQPTLDGASMVWLTNISPVQIAADPERCRHDLGLTSHILDCDRLDYVFTPISAVYQPFNAWAATQRSQIRRTCQMLAYGRRAGSWWISLDPVDVVELPIHMLEVSEP